MNIILIGATGGIGKSLSYELSKKHNLFLGSRNQNNIEQLIYDITQESIYDNNHNSIGGCSVDASSFKSIEDFIDSAQKFLISVDCIIS